MNAPARWRALLPGLRIPAFPPLSVADRMVLFVGTGGGSGFLKPFSASWGSIPGFVYGLALLMWTPTIVAAIGTLAVLGISVPVARRCAELAGDDDPKCVVIDEIAAVPLALWPLGWVGRPLELWEIAVLFVVYRLADLAKPFPARRLEALPGGWGIVLDDVVSALYMSGLWFFGMMVYASQRT